MSHGRTLDVYGKTGTGDRRFGMFARGGRLIESRKVNRAADLTGHFRTRRIWR